MAQFPNGTPYTGSASGIWNMKDVRNARMGDNWPEGVHLPYAPTSLVATPFDASVSVTFTAPTNDGGYTITEYTLTSSPGSFTATGESSPIMVTGLTNGTAYNFTAFATTSLGNSPTSSVSNTVTPSSVAPPTTIGEAYGGGYYAGQISMTQDGNPTHWLIVAPLSTGQSSGLKYDSTNSSGNPTSSNDGPENTATLVAAGSTREAATFCAGLSIGGYTDWYMPSQDELEVMYYNLKPSTTSNYTSWGSNPSAVSPEPISTNYTAGAPAQTSVTIFQAGGSQAWPGEYFQSSTSTGGTLFYYEVFVQGYGGSTGLTWTGGFVRAIRRIAM